MQLPVVIKPDCKGRETRFDFLRIEQQSLQRDPFMTTQANNEFPARDFYTRFYDALPRSRAYAELCRQSYGADSASTAFRIWRK